MTSTQPIIVQPNVFELGGYNTQISYSTTSSTGVPELIYTNRGETLNFRGEQIRTEQTQLGQMVTVNLSSSLQGISPVESLSLLIPMVNLPADNRQGSIQMIAIFSLRSPAIPGQSQNYMTLCLSGTASQIDF